jgi:hypothetical protein
MSMQQMSSMLFDSFKAIILSVRFKNLSSVFKKGIPYSKQYVSNIVCDTVSFELSVSATVRILLGSLLFKEKFLKNKHI